MKIKLADGNEVEVADDSPLAVAARELETVQKLGYDSIEAYQKAKEEESEKLKKHNADNDEFINRQKTELGDLRKEKESLSAKLDEFEKSKTKEPKVDDKTETPEQREERFRVENQSIQSALNDEERKYADEEFRKQYSEASPEVKTLLNSEEGKREFLNMVFPDREDAKKAPVTLFSKPEEKALSTAELVRRALEKDDAGRSRKPIIPNSRGSAYKPKGNDKANEKSKPQVPLSVRSGGVLDAVLAIDKQGD